MQWILGVAAVATALGVIVQKVIRPLGAAVIALDKIVPVVKRLAEQFADDPRAFAILDEIVKQVRTDGGSSLLDKINTINTKVTESVEILTAQTREARAAAEVLAAQVDAVKQLAAMERSQSVRDRAQIDEMDAHLVRMSNMLTRLEAEGGRVAGELEAAQDRADVVSADPATDAGAAADEASGSPPDVRPEA